MTDRPLDDILADLKGAIHHFVAGGFMPVTEIVDQAVEYLGDDVSPESIRGLTEQMTRKEIDKHRKDQETWPRVTDCDRLDAAFADLESKGILARQDYSCCGTCGAAEIWEELKEGIEAGKPIRGYTFYHQQDTDLAVDGGGVYLNYGASENDEEDIAAIAQEVITELRRHGLKPEWPGTLDKRIAVPLVWQRRGPVSG